MGSIPTDKDGGFCLVNKKEWYLKMKEILDSENYQPIETHSLFYEDLWREYCEVCRIASKELDDPLLLRSLMADRWQPVEKAVSNLSCTIKTHKNPGKVVLRALHASPATPFKPAMRWVAHVCPQRVTSLPHMLRDSRELVNIINERSFPDNAKFLKADVKDFFMSGEHKDLIECCSNEIEDSSLKNAFRDIASFIVSNQFISLKDCEKIHKVKIGTGMGLVCSGEMSDLCFYSLSEKHWSTDRKVMDDHEIYLYVRFKDDILMIVNGESRMWLKYFHEMKNRSKFFVVEMESSSDQSVVMMDVEIFKGPKFKKCNMLDHRVHVKDTSIWSPLSPTSSHPMNIHAAWPAGMVKRFKWLSSSNGDFELSKEMLLKRIHRDRSCLDLMKNPKSQFFSRMIMKFHPAWQSTPISGAIKEATREFSGEWNTISVGWKLSDTRLVHRLLRLNWEEHESARKFDIWC